MSGKNIIFNDKKINESNFYRGKKLFKVDEIDINKILAFQKELYCKKKTYLNTLLGTTILITLDHYV